MGRIFGTDGARGIAGHELTVELALNLGRAAAMVLASECGKKPKVLIGKDTRISGCMLESAVSAGLCSVGADVVLLGVVPTPAVAYLTQFYKADAAVMISASHNPFEFNGIKLFGGDGFKLTDEDEEKIEAIILDGVSEYQVKTGDEIGTVSYETNGVDAYVDYLAKYYDGDYEGRILVDCACGSASATAEKLFSKLNVNTHIIHSEPNGININENCGSTHIEKLAKKVVDEKYDMGFAFDGDADRFLAVDEKGNILDGDFLLSIISEDLKEKGKLKKDTVVVTTMTNLAFMKLMEKRGNKTEITAVGDRYILEKMRAEGYSLGGEQSGHFILLDYLKTGDGQLSSIALLNAVSRKKMKLSQLAEDLKPFPQTMLNVNATPSMKKALNSDKNVMEVIEKWKNHFGEKGRIVVRPSGTEPYIRVMIEGEIKEEIEKAAREIADTISSQLI